MIPYNPEPNTPPSRPWPQAPLRRCHSSAFTLIELLVVVAILAILASLLAAGVTKAMASAHRIGCASNMRQIGNAMRMFLSDHDGRFPVAGRHVSHPAGDGDNITWDDQLGGGYDGRDMTDAEMRAGSLSNEWRSKTQIYRCPATKYPDNIRPWRGYAGPFGLLHGNGRPGLFEIEGSGLGRISIMHVTTPSRSIMLACIGRKDHADHLRPMGYGYGSYIAPTHELGVHGGGVNVLGKAKSNYLMIDGSVQTLTGNETGKTADLPQSQNYRTRWSRRINIMDGGATGPGPLP